MIVMVIAIGVAVVFSLTLLVLIRWRKWVDGINRAIDEAFKEAEMKELE